MILWDREGFKYFIVLVLILPCPLFQKYCTVIVLIFQCVKEENYCHHHHTTLFTMRIMTIPTLRHQHHFATCKDPPTDCSLSSCWNGSECSFLYWLSLMLLKVQSLTLSEWQIVMVFKLERSQHTQHIKHHFAHLSNSLCFVLMARIVGRHLSLDDLLERWQCRAHCSYLARHLCCSALLEEHLFHVEWFQFRPGKRCLQNGTLHLGHQHPNGILKNGSVCVLGVMLSGDSLLLGKY